MYTQCCDKGVVTIGTKDFCTEVIEDGLVCHFDVQCKSGNCEGNNYGINEGKQKGLIDSYVYSVKSLKNTFIFFYMPIIFNTHFIYKKKE